MDVRENPVGGINVVLRDVFPNLVEIAERIRAGWYVGHRVGWRRSDIVCRHGASPLARAVARSMSFRNSYSDTQD